MDFLYLIIFGGGDPGWFTWIVWYIHYLTGVWI